MKETIELIMAFLGGMASMMVLCVYLFKNREEEEDDDE